MKKKSILICILTLVVLAFSVTNVFALGLDIGDDNNSSETQQPQQPQQPSDVKDNNNNNNNNDVKKDSPVPDTGIEDAPIIAIGVCIVLSVVGYVQIKKNNV